MKPVRRTGCEDIVPSTSPGELPNEQGEPVASGPRPIDPTAIILAALWSVMTVLAVLHFGGTTRSERTHEGAGCVDPNVAPWWELTVLPRIGPATAHSLVHYRQTVQGAANGSTRTPAFEQKADLTRVRGIGPKTLQRISPYLCLGRQ
ncbi:MAG: helix-hairpin-helix domain-containing protein [Planctomycetes bacterium]|nr:helix-hairpin-helix domain-containing protein [Planctomycetota bacterium]